ncbi:expansin-A16-like [Wolffia australiana]
MACRLVPLLVVVAAALLLVTPLADGGWLRRRHFHGKFQPGPWSLAHATFYGGADGGDTRGGACGYGDTVSQGYGVETAALSTALFAEGLTCGACYEVRCAGDARRCAAGRPAVVVSGTNSCPPNYALAGDRGGWCNPPRAHFDLAQPAFVRIATYEAGIVPVEYRRVACPKRGGMRFTVRGNPYFYLLLVWNVAGAGDVRAVQVKGDRLGWTELAGNWGQVWQTGARLLGESLSFRVTTSDGRRCTSWHVAPRDWQLGQTFHGKNFPF